MDYLSLGDNRPTDREQSVRGINTSEGCVYTDFV